MIEVKTRSGSVYQLNDATKTWQRMSHSEESRLLRTEQGTFNIRSELELGAPLNMICPPLVEGATFRYISTSPVTDFKLV